MSVIDLGEIRPDDAPPPVADRTRPPRRALRCLLVLVLTLGTLAAAVPRPQRVSSILPASVGATAALVDDRLFVFERQSAETGGDPRLTAWALPAVDRPADRPRMLWQTQVPDLLRLFDVVVRDGLVIAAGFGERSGTTVVLDAVTGARRWRQPGSGSLTTGGNLLLTGGRGADGQIRVVEVATGRPIWVLPVGLDGAALTFRADRIERVVLTTDDGRIEVRSADTGAVLVSRPVVADPAPPSVSVIDDVVLASQGSTGSVTAYGLDRLDVRWTGSFPRVEYFVSCGPAMFCAFQRNRPISVLERDTGRIRWQSEDWWVWQELGNRLFVMAVAGSRVADPNSYGVLDAATGRVLGRVGPWQPAAGRSNTPYAPLLVRPAGERGLLVAELDVAAAEVRLLDILPGADRDCQAEADRLLCRTQDGFGVWALRRAVATRH
ncbi:outer membrane protein assembly factor BamB family protein [Micromonospora yangpuensis]|uniref:PQQ-like domain-containing protein n=1 Tax=Micromonospora yangpuensis TaxID=683228 RepID=A0A1C6UDG5_9ACTN|nr:PQQ-binding-like beta-propeller repeat protein [Micromonospora yangpuensis]GGM27076.1 hypothetical protein GCM10012279_52030 [Micromonospora yangpuensis]SCL52110.1 PQQ-like domain-containing protein [Micromonospora yangpuensis]